MSTYPPESGTPGDAGTFPTRARSFARDLFERVASTAVEAGLAFAAVEVADLPAVWVPVGTALLAVVKGWAGKYVGRPDSASLDPSV